jgi:hypothetical protein
VNSLEVTLRRDNFLKFGLALTGQDLSRRMRVKPLQVLWHTKLSIFSADFQPTPNRPVQTCETVEGSAPEEIKSKDWSTSSGRLATCGADGFVRVRQPYNNKWFQPSKYIKN